MDTILVTGSAGFIGYHICQRLLDDGFKVIGIDSFTKYYDLKLKEDRSSLLKKNTRFKEIRCKLEDPNALLKIFGAERPSYVIHLAAQAGVRYSIENPRAYMESNLIGTFELLEAARAYPPRHMLLASTSSAYGANIQMPYKECQKADHQVSFYAATKKSTENIAHSYSHLFELPITMFRFFTVYGPWGRPDMAAHKFTKSILNDVSIQVYNHGRMKRDFTYISDLCEGIRLLLNVIPNHKGEKLNIINDSLSPVAPWRVVNIGNSKPVDLFDFIAAIEFATGSKAKKELLPMQAGDVHATWADNTLLKDLTGYSPKTNIQDGIKVFVNWYKEYYLK